MNMSEKVGRLGPVLESTFYHTVEKICGKVMLYQKIFSWQKEGHDVIGHVIKTFRMFEFVFKVPFLPCNFRLLFYSSIYSVYSCFSLKKTWWRLVMVSRHIVYLGLFHAVWSDFLTLILFSSFSIDHDLVWSNVELHVYWSFKVSEVVFQALICNILCICLLSIRTWRHLVWRQGAF